MDLDLQSEIYRTQPDFIVYVPHPDCGNYSSTGNEHFIVFDGPDENLMSVWTQSTHEQAKDHRIVFSSSCNQGKNWTAPITIAGDGSLEKRASWGFPMLSASGRIYVIYNRFCSKVDSNPGSTGLMAGIYSDNNGQSWSQEEIIPMRKSRCWDSTVPDMPSNWIVWQKPERLADDRYLAGFTREVSPTRRNSNSVPRSVTEFMTFNNIDENPEIKDIDISWLAKDETALNIPGHCVEEPCWEILPDKRILAIMRSTLNVILYAISDDNGISWSSLQILRQKEHGMIFIHQYSPCPFYSLGNGEYILFFHNNTETFRNPIFFCKGHFVPQSKQGIEWGDIEFFASNNSVPIGPGERTDFALYSSLTFVNEKPVLWYPDRKYFLLGKYV
jgi:hypothetical protein